MSAAWRMKAFCLAGRIILENGGETYRAEDTVIHMAQSLGLCEVDVFGVPSGLFISFTDENGERQTSVTRIFPRATHLARVDAVNQISRKLAGKALEPVWHRATLDLLAAIALIDSGRFVGRVISYRAGHTLDIRAVTQLYAQGLLTLI